MSERVFLHEAWTDIATEYSKRKLTFVEDRFLAIAAVAKHIQRKAHPFLRPLNESNKPPRATNDKSLGAGGWAQLLQMAQDFWETTKAIDEHMIARYNISYYAGCWSHLFIEHLCWQRKYDLNQHPPAWQLVTWSWISVGSEVEFMIKPRDFPEVEILDYSITSQPNNDPFSNITTTELKIRGHILPINGYSYHTLFGSFCTNISLDLTAETWSNDMSAGQQRRESYSRTFVQKTFGDDEAKYVSC